MTFDDLDPKSVLRFGKYKGKTVEYVIKHNLNYIMWAMEQAPNLLKTKPVVKKQIIILKPQLTLNQNLLNGRM